MKLKTIIILVISLYTQVRVNAQTIFKGNIVELKENSKVYICSMRTNKIDSTDVKDHQFQFNLNNVSGEIFLFNWEKKGVWKMIYLQNGLLKIKGDTLNYRITGSPYAVDYDNFNETKRLNVNFRKVLKLNHLINDAKRSNDTVTIAKLSRQRTILMPKVSKMESEWIAKHLSSPISSYIIYTSMYVYEDSSRKAWEAALSKLSPAAKNNYLAKEMLGPTSIPVYNNSKVGQPGFDFTQADTAGHLISFKDFRGKYTLIDFWASWCIPCRDENPNLVKTFDKFKDKNFTIISISVDKNKSDWIKAINKDKLNWTNLSDLKYWDNQVAKLYEVKGVPTNILVDPDGKVIAKDLRGDDLDKFLKTHL